MPYKKQAKSIDQCFDGQVPWAYKKWTPQQLTQFKQGNRDIPIRNKQNVRFQSKTDTCWISKQAFIPTYRRDTKYYNSLKNKLRDKDLIKQGDGVSRQ